MGPDQKTKYSVTLLLVSMKTLISQLTYSPGKGSLAILTSISVTAYGAVPHSKCKE